MDRSIPSFNNRHVTFRNFYWFLVILTLFFTSLEIIRGLGGIYAYYAEWTLSFFGLSTIGPKCAGILAELKARQRGYPNRWWWRRMRCEGAYNGALPWTGTKAVSC